LKQQKHQLSDNIISLSSVRQVKQQAEQRSLYTIIHPYHVWSLTRRHSDGAKRLRIGPEADLRFMTEGRNKIASHPRTEDARNKAPKS